MFVFRVLIHARRLFAEYLNEDWTPSPQPNPVSQEGKIKEFKI